jgi:hypothetical protein
LVVSSEAVSDATRVVSNCFHGCNAAPIVPPATAILPSQRKITLDMNIAKRAGDTIPPAEIRARVGGKGSELHEVRHIKTKARDEAGAGVIAGKLLRAYLATPLIFKKADHGVPAHDQALHMTVTRFHLFCALLSETSEGTGNVDHRRPALRASTRGQMTITCQPPIISLGSNVSTFFQAS